MGDFLIIDWSPHYAILVYDDGKAAEQTQSQSAQKERGK